MYRCRCRLFGIIFFMEEPFTMKKALVYALFTLLMALPAYTQDKTAEKKPGDTEKTPIGDQLYREITVEDFETTTYTDKDITFTKSKDQKAGAAIREDFPAPIGNSKKYLGLKIFGKRGDALTVNPSRKLAIDKYCRTISMWVYGKNFSGELSIFVSDANGRTHRLSFGKLNYLGWRKLTVKIPDDVAQEDKYLTQKREIVIIKILYLPGNTDRLPIWNYFYIDDITALVREKYTDRQSDEW